MGERFFHLSAGARQVYDRASAVLGFDVAALCFRTPSAELRRTTNAQVAVVATDIAADALLRELGFRPDVVAGHSVGELAALVAAGCLDLETAMLTTRKRAELMESVRTPGTMASVVGPDTDRVQTLCAETGVVVAAVNADRHTVVSGQVDAVAELARRARADGARVVPLDVSHAFHSPLMASVIEPWSSHLSELPFEDPAVPIVVNVAGAVRTHASEVRQALVDQVTMPIRWRETLHTVRSMAGRASALVVEAGDSRVLTGLARASDGSLTALSLRDPRTITRLRRTARRSA